MMNKITNPETGKPVQVTGLMSEFGVRVKTDGTAQFSSQKEVSMWQYVIAIFGLPWALMRFFDRSEFPKDFKNNN